MKATKDKLNYKQQAFIYEYLKNGFNGKQACISVGYAPKNAEITASKLLRLSKVQDVFNKAFQDNGLEVNKALQNISIVANTDVTDYMEADTITGLPKLKPLDQMQNTKAIKSIKINEDKAEITFHDSLKANEIIVKMAGKMAPDTNIQINNVADNDRVELLINTIIENDTK